MFYEIIQVLVHGQISTVQVQVMSDKRGATVSGFNMCGVWTSSYTAMRHFPESSVSSESVISKSRCVSQHTVKAFERPLKFCQLLLGYFSRVSSELKPLEREVTEH